MVQLSDLELADIIWDPRVKWNEPGARFGEVGLDRGVVYLDDGIGRPWNGLVNVDNSPQESESTEYHIDGVRRLIVPRGYNIDGSIEAFMVPEELKSYLGSTELVPGFSTEGQLAKPFSMTYRSKIVNDVTGPEHGYNIHILYNILATPSDFTYSTIEDGLEVATKSWDYKTTPIIRPGQFPSAKFTINSTRVDPIKLAVLEANLYGYGTEDAHLPGPDEIAEILL